MCIWEGVAEVQLQLTFKGTNIPFTLHTINFQQYHKDTIINGYTIKLEKLTPYPTTSVVINQKEYEATLVVSK
jgi:hypothetical protein